MSLGDAIRGLIDPFNPAVREWLRRELPRLVAEGYIEAPQADLIARRYGVRLNGAALGMSPTGADDAEKMGALGIEDGTPADGDEAAAGHPGPPGGPARRRCWGSRHTSGRSRHASQSGPEIAQRSARYAGRLRSRGIGLRWRVVVIGGISGTVLVALRQLFDAVATLPGWAILGGRGLLLLGGAVALLLARARLAEAGRPFAERWSNRD
jgi:hypothetical protein